MTGRLRLRAAVGAAGLVVATGYGVGPAAAPAGAVACQPVPGSGGLTAAQVVLSAQTLSGFAVDASACDIGIYVGPGGDGTVLDHVTVTGAKAEGVLLQGVSDVSLVHSTVTGSAHDAGAFGSHPPKAVMLVGTRGVLVEDNDITGNFGGGVAVNDDGAVPTGTLAPGAPAPAVRNVVRGNRFSRNARGCAVVVGAYNAGQGVISNVVTDNTMTGAPGVMGPYGPVDITAIVVAANTPNSLAQDNRVMRNTVSQSLIPGIIVHANAPGALAVGTVVVNNVLDRTDWGQADGPQTTVGISVATQNDHAAIRDTSVAGNRIDGVDIGIWLHGDVQGTNIGGYGVNHANRKVVWG